MIEVDCIFGAVIASAVRDLQQQHGIPVTERVNPTTWEVLDMHANPYRSPIPWKQQNITPPQAIGGF
ncbi:peptidoglycan-binding protein [Nodosilinea sp. LEGE 06152]|uniref:peptidoglycan-binding domain-containing protein n=1 Tax=Nodosilinea sp. LEGE 06152 TaxID=2777966 RepID=UPI0018807CF3|nr:peptidoglycan-binding domain-containing protein [Nodosilinea sp. LEGE 06152]MBE9157786.1 peptidoglycan-binding protein [Nodosilinea sp. LEGE 06152]